MWVPSGPSEHLLHLWQWHLINLVLMVLLEQGMVQDIQVLQDMQVLRNFWKLT